MQLKSPPSVRHALRILAAEFECAMALSGATSVAALRGRADGAGR